MKRIIQFFRTFYGQALLLAIFIRILVMPFFYHPDIKSHHFHFYFFSQGVVNIYRYLADNIASLPYTDTFNYPPLVYFFFGIIQFLLRPFLGGGFVHWIFDWGPFQIYNSQIFRYLLILKIPYLLFEILLAFLLTQFFREKRQKQRVFIFWLFNPVVIYSLYILGHFDILPTLLSILAILLLTKNRWAIGSLILGAATAFKTYPLLFLPFFMIFGGTRRYGKVKILVLGLLPYFLTNLPYIKSEAFRQTVFFSSLTQRLFIPSISLGFGESLIIFVMVYVVLLFVALRYFADKKEKAIPFCTATLLFVFSLIHFHPQWIVWVLPFLTIILVKNPSLLSLQIAFYLSFFGVVFLFNDRAQLFGLLAPIDPDFWGIPSIFELLKERNIIDPLFIQSLFHSILAGTGLLLIWESFKNE